MSPEYGDMESKAATAENLSPAARERLRFYRVRSRIYSGLLVFVVVAGLPVISVPALRHRLAGRVHVFRAAMAGGYRPSVASRIGENNTPFPPEFDHPVAHRNFPQLPPSITGMAQQPFNAGQIYPQRAPRKSARASSAEAESPPTLVPSEPKPAQPAQASETPSEDALPVYRQGKMEQEIYDILLKNDANVAALVQGKNPSLQFKSWDVAKREEDLYWVRILFTQLPDKNELECIWQVQPMSKQAMPLNYNARSLPKG